LCIRILTQLYPHPRNQGSKDPQHKEGPSGLHPQDRRGHHQHPVRGHRDQDAGEPLLAGGLRVGRPRPARHLRGPRGAGRPRNPARRPHGRQEG